MCDVCCLFYCVVCYFCLFIVSLSVLFGVGLFVCYSLFFFLFVFFVVGCLSCFVLFFVVWCCLEQVGTSEMFLSFLFFNFKMFKVASLNQTHFRITIATYMS